MLSRRSEHGTLLPSLRGGDWSGGGWLSGRRSRPEPSPALMIAGVVAVGLAAWACYKMGPELVRYLKIRRM